VQAFYAHTVRLFFHYFSREGIEFRFHPPSQQYKEHCRHGFYARRRGVTDSTLKLIDDMLDTANTLLKDLVRLPEASRSNE
jgi:hypothetical protein